MNDKYEYRGLVYLSQEDIEKIGMDMKTAVECIREVLSLHDKKEVIMPSKVILDLDERRHGRINAMPAYIGGSIKMCGIKWIAGFPNNPENFGLPRANAIVVLNDSKNGLPLAILEGTRISALRTGAVTGVGAHYLARKDSRQVGLIGAGVQAFTQLKAICHVLKGIEQVRVYDVRPESSLAFVNRCKEEFMDMVFCKADSAEEAVSGADVVVTATIADEPIVKASWLKKGVFFAHVGSYQEEEEAVILEADKVVVDIWEEVLHRGTPLLARMYRQGKIDASRIHADIGKIINGEKAGRETEDEKIFFCPLGLGSEDVAVAAKIYKTAVETGIGIKLPFNRPVAQTVEGRC
jgi:Predicted ornithine cyclodeaminase, mu-crystallin homolog